jgi:macrodomain Ter protein organizer (MatP/YcbG family)
MGIKRGCSTMKDKFKILLNASDIVSNRKILSVKLAVWKKLISISNEEEIPISKVIDKAITKYIQENNYDIETIFKNNIEVKQMLFRENKQIATVYNIDDSI